MINRLPSGTYYGETVGRLETAKFALNLSDLVPRERVPNHAHERPYFCFLSSGGFREWDGRYEEAITPAMVVYHPEGHPHANLVSPSGGRCLNIEVSPTWAADLGLLPREPLRTVGGAATLICRQIQREVEQPDDLSLLSCEALIVQLLAEDARSRRGRDDSSPAWLKRVEDAMQADVSYPWSLDELAAVAGVHPVHLSRTYRRCRNRTLTHELRRLRVEKAAVLLQASDASAGDIAYAVGFNDQAQFTRVFKAAFGVSPGQFRRRNARG